jgi:putative N6-adenine-specific DNA methylase
MTNSPLDLFAVAAPGLEPLLAAELAELGIDAAPEPGGAAWRSTLEDLYAANLRLRTASRVLVRVGEFRARTFFELERHAGKLPWERFVAPGAAVEMRVSCRKSKLYHEGAVAERLLRAVAERVGPLTEARAAKGEEAEEDEAGEAAAQLFVVRFLHDRCTVSADASGERLHRRGYRQALARAPLRETLAAALLQASGWRTESPLLDPMCGSGTIAIEAALRARRIAPGLANEALAPRRYAFERWPGFDAALWRGVVERARAEVLPAAPAAIHGSDRDAGAVEAALANAARAGVAGDISFAQRPLSAAEVPDAAQGPGWLVTNPPYGVRVGEERPLRNLYAALGRLVRERLDGWTLALLSADRRLEAQVGIPLEEVLRTKNGGLSVRVVVGRVG